MYTVIIQRILNRYVVVWTVLSCLDAYPCVDASGVPSLQYTDVYPLFAIRPISKGDNAISRYFDSSMVAQHHYVGNAGFVGK